MFEVVEAYVIAVVNDDEKFSVVHVISELVGLPFDSLGISHSNFNHGENFTSIKKAESLKTPRECKNFYSVM